VNQGHATLLSGWGRLSPTAATVIAPADEAAVSEMLAGSSGPALLARGAGRSYGDAAQCAGGTVVTLGSFRDIGPIDTERAEVEVGAGLLLEDLLAHCLPRGYTTPVSPGTRQVTIGGAVAADVHGKNHHRDGSICAHVRALTLATPTGTRRVTPESDPDLFWATAGGMGLTGVVTSVRLGLLGVETSWMQVRTERFPRVEDAMAAMEARDAEVRYSVAWVDCAGAGPGGPRGTGRAVLSTGDHAGRADLRGASRRAPLRAPRAGRLAVPFNAPGRLLNRRSAQAFNTVWFHASPRHPTTALHALGSFFHPLDAVGGWNRLYGGPGFVQYQFVVPPSRGDVVLHVLAAISRSRVPSVLGVLKRFGPGNPGPLSFPIEGWTLALDFPASAEGLPGLLDRFDEEVIGASGRVYLAKDARLSPMAFRAMYPELAAFQRVRREVDPTGRLASDLARRLGIVDQVSSERAFAPRAGTGPDHREEARA